MARKKKATNAIDAEVAAEFIERIEGLKADLKSEHGSYMAACKVIRDDIKEAYDEAKEKGVPRKFLKIQIEKRELERKKDALTAKLDDDERITLEQLESDLGSLVDLPLGKAAMDAQRRRDGEQFDLEDKLRKRTDEELAGTPEEAADRVMDRIAGDPEPIGDQASTETVTA